jgi:hypothetical protein
MPLSMRMLASVSPGASAGIAKGVIFAPIGCAMTLTHTRKRGGSNGPDVRFLKSVEAGNLRLTAERFLRRCRTAESTSPEEAGGARQTFTRIFAWLLAISA